MLRARARMRVHLVLLVSHPLGFICGHTPLAHPIASAGAGRLVHKAWRGGLAAASSPMCHLVCLGATRQLVFGSTENGPFHQPTPASARRNCHVAPRRGGHGSIHNIHLPPPRILSARWDPFTKLGPSSNGPPSSARRYRRISPSPTAYRFSLTKKRRVK